MFRRSVLLLLCSILALAGVAALPTARAQAAGCPNVVNLFARGTAETAPPVGITGLAFQNALQSRLPGRNVQVRPVDYPASSNFNSREAIVRSVMTGVQDAQKQITGIVDRCPRTKIVLGGYSQGAVVAAYTVNGGLTMPARNAEYSWLLPKQLPEKVASHVAAVVLIAPPSSRWMRDLGAPQLTVGKNYRAKTARYCTPGDTVCDGSPVGQPNELHVLYPLNGTIDRAADFAAARVRR